MFSSYNRRLTFTPWKSQEQKSAQREIDLLLAAAYELGKNHSELGVHAPPTLSYALKHNADELPGLSDLLERRE
jgi:hypothetical protein